jgi:hypothetical protein
MNVKRRSVDNRNGYHESRKIKTSLQTSTMRHGPEALALLTTAALEAIAVLESLEA